MGKENPIPIASNRFFKHRLIKGEALFVAYVDPWVYSKPTDVTI